MRVTTHGAYLTQLTRLPHVFPVNCYLVREDDGLTLVDVALPGSAPAIRAAARKLGAPIRASCSRMRTWITWARSTRYMKDCRAPRC